MDCGQSDSISRLVHHVTEDQKFQEGIGDPRASIVGLNQGDLTAPQSFRTNDLTKEMGHIESQRILIPSSSSSYFSVQSHSSLGTIWTREYQNEMHETFQPKIQQMWDFQNASNYENKTNYEDKTNHENKTNYFSEGFSGLKGLEGLKSWPLWIADSQNFKSLQHRSNAIHHALNQLESKSRESRESSADLEGTTTIENLDELKHLNQAEESSTYLQENKMNEITKMV